MRWLYYNDNDRSDPCDETFISNPYDIEEMLQMIGRFSERGTPKMLRVLTDPETENHLKEIMANNAPPAGNEEDNSLVAHKNREKIDHICELELVTTLRKPIPNVMLIITNMNRIFIIKALYENWFPQSTHLELWDEFVELAAEPFEIQAGFKTLIQQKPGLLPQLSLGEPVAKGKLPKAPIFDATFDQHNHCDLFALAIRDARARTAIAGGQKMRVDDMLNQGLIQ